MWSRFQGDEQADGEIPEGKAVELPPQETKIDQFYITKRMLRITDTLVGVLAAEVGSVVWVSSRTRLSAARDSES